MSTSYPEDWPHDCPPTGCDISVATDVFRTVKTDPPTGESFRNAFEEGLYPRACQCQRRSLSVSLTLSAAQHIVRKYRSRGRHVARARLGPGDGAVKQTGNNRHHYSWWPSLDRDSRRVDGFEVVYTLGSKS